MKITQFNLNKLTTAGLVAVSVISSLSLSSTANAALVSGNASITIDNAAVLTSMAAVSEKWYFGTHWGPSDNTLGINYAATGGTALPQNGSASFLFPVNGAPNAIPGTGCPGAGSSPCVVAEYPTAGTYGRTIQATTMDASNTSIAGQQIGLSGAFRMLKTPDSGAYLGPYDLSLVKYGSEWNIRTYDTSFTYGNLFELRNVSESVNGNGELLLSGDLYWSDPFFTGGIAAWSNLFGGVNTSTKIGTFNLTPAAVPLPAAVWLFGGALMGFLGLTRKKLNY
jgi:hypothetical protein